MVVSTIGSLKKKSSSPRIILGSVMTGLSGLCMIVTLIPLIAVLFFVLVQGFSRINIDLFTQLPPPPGLDEGGLANAIIGTLVVVGIAVILAVPIGVLAAVYLSEFSHGNKFATSIRFATNVLSGVPSIIAGIFAFGLLVSSGIVGFSAIAGGVSLAVLMLPTIIRTTDEALKIVPQEIRWAALGVGAYNYQTVVQIVLPAALPGIVTGVTLAIARAAGETAPLIFTALFSNFWPNVSAQGLAEPIATLSVLVYNFAILPFKPQQELAWAGSLILVFLVLSTSILARLATRRKLY
ncbi:MAG: phosphate ABC transporter permease PstA [Cyanobacteria bacterium]|uniref:phosphate ABC transporter permease PstA n=1 Tax=Geminocystis sp. TaxID=2664100 RepID=UPI001D882BC5|nr:phosphate ABC transporter permease PstA [Cyanobacteria bacterium CG_2015-16_32_12]NCO78032.1 phosphate ABC transporter permease PstA [Cyanobacteria bacterium CG_2015-22_32_23]NCQ05176.1 phosphate ABC transporter permease PstA [Cyanobacteria bacterium CG_2015-09_32_10]NCQ43086.1 phosphate ABC transporter permease PstA [Cyanobacteria bacterium CG_2015-04_32_10]NCS83701.1 phosphate ABC transporter permease PstA [Cyanobacteria bacterium CG_2015-02_32_10]